MGLTNSKKLIFLSALLLGLSGCVSPPRNREKIAAKECTSKRCVEIFKNRNTDRVAFLRSLYEIQDKSYARRKEKQQLKYRFSKKHHSLEGEKKRLAIDLCSPEIEQQGFDIVHQVLYEDADLDKNQASCNVHADGSHYSITVDGNSGKTRGLDITSVIEEQYHSYSSRR